MLRFGLIGFGYWGPKLARNINENASLKAIAEISPKRLACAQKQYPNARAHKDHEEIIKAIDIDVVVIATPIFTHYDLVKSALKNGKHVLVTKPFVSQLDHAKELIDLAEKKNLIIAVDHTFLFSGVVEEIKNMVTDNSIGELLYYDSVRINLGLFQQDVNVIWDLAPHDISIMLYLLGKYPDAISAQGTGHFKVAHENIAYLTAIYPNNFIAHFHLNWLSPVKIRKTILGGSKKMIVWNDLDQENKLKIYDKGVSIKSTEKIYSILADYRIGEMRSPIVSTEEPLKKEINQLISCIEQKKEPINNAYLAAKVVSIIESAQLSLRSQGRYCKIQRL